MNAYFDLMVSLMFMCLLACLLLVPVFYGFSNKHANPNLQIDEGLMKYTMGNLAGAEAICRQRQLKIGTMKLHCGMGNIMIDERTQVGLMSREVEQKFHCTE
jgi:hypothetical protein